MYNPNVNILNNVVKSNEVGTNIAIIALITINGPKGIYSSAFFFIIIFIVNELLK